MREAFLDENVIIYLKDMNVVTATPEGNEIAITAMIQGYVVNIDTDFLYLGQEDGTILKAIQHQPGQLIELEIPNMQGLIPDYPESEEDVH